MGVGSDFFQKSFRLSVLSEEVLLNEHLLSDNR